MAEITRRRTGELLRVVFKILMDNPDGYPASSTIEELKKAITLSEYEAGMYDSGGQRVDKIVRFATVDCVKAGWLVKSKGKWSITDEGKDAYDRLTDQARRRLPIKPVYFLAMDE